MVDYLIVGAGLFGATCARALADARKRVLVVEQAGHVGGMAYTERRGGQLMNLHGGHIFHTNDRRLWDWMQRFGEMKPYTHKVLARAGETVYSFPPNRMTLQQLGLAVDSPVADGVLRRTFFEGYTAKQWGRPLDQVPAGVIKRIPYRCTWDDRYFTDEYQGLPADGYTPLVENMLRGLPLELGADYLDRATYWDQKAVRVIYTGAIDALFGYQLGRLEYRSLRFEHERMSVDDFQGCATMNYCDAAVPWLRVEEWRHWGPWATNGGGTWITRTYPDAGGPPLYPVNDERNQALYADYAKLAAGHKRHVIVGGRLGAYRYWDMHQAIGAALHLVSTLVKE